MADEIPVTGAPEKPAASVSDQADYKVGDVDPKADNRTLDAIDGVPNDTATPEASTLEKAPVTDQANVPNGAPVPPLPPGPEASPVLQFDPKSPIVSLEGLTKKIAGSIKALDAGGDGGDKATGGVSGEGARTPTAVVPYSDDKTRRNVAYILLWTLIGVIVVEMLASSILSQDCWSDPKRCSVATASLGIITGTLNSIFTAIVGLVGSVVGFYFGSKSK